MTYYNIDSSQLQQGVSMTTINIKIFVGESLANFSMSNFLQNLPQQAQTPHTSLYLLSKRNELS